MQIKPEENPINRRDAATVEESGEDVASQFIGAQEVLREVPRRSDRRHAESEALGIGLHHAAVVIANLDAALEIRGERVVVGDVVRVDRRQQRRDDHEEQDCRAAIIAARFRRNCCIDDRHGLSESMAVNATSLISEDLKGQEDFPYFTHSWSTYM